MSPSKSKVKGEPRSGKSAIKRVVDSDGEDATADGHSPGGTLNRGLENGVQNVSSSDEQEIEEIESPNGTKRARIDEAGHAAPVQKKEKNSTPRRTTLRRDSDGYVPGSIVRVQLTNFVTYDWVEFRPGPGLNMILGPNGTGKSSIACALCIGLNGSPSILGRSSELNAFVKHGHETGYVEIEMKGRIGTRNLIIRRNINSKNRSSQFTLNGQNVPAREISERITELNVQVGNLCSFLPQDRVSEFAQMTPQQLLKETQRTAGDENLSMWHATLIEKGKELIAAQSLLKEDKKEIAYLEEKQKLLEKDVKRFHERREIEHRIELFELVLPYVLYKDSKKNYDKARELRARAADEYRRLEEEHKPMKDLQEQLSGEFDALGDERNKLKKNAADEYKKRMSSLNSRNTKATQRAEEALDTIRSLKRKEKDRNRNLLKLKDEVVKCQEKVDNPPECEDVQAILDQIKTYKAQKVEVEVKREHVKRQVEALLRGASAHDQTILGCKQDLQKLDDLKGRKIQELRRWDADCADVVMWFEHNKNANPFAQRVTLPAYMTLAVPDQRYVHAVEACLSANQLKTFVTHSDEDFRTFNRLFIDTPEALGRKARVTVWFRPQNDAQLLRPPLEVDELRNIGFDGYAIDYIECPPGLRWFLVKEINMHRTSVALDARKVDEHRAQEALSRLSADGRAPPDCSYIAGDTIGMVSRSAYGQRKSMNTTKTIQRARNLVVPAADPAAKREIEQRLAEASSMNAELQVQVLALRKEDEQLHQELQELKVPHDELIKRKDAATAVRKQIATNESKLASVKKRLQELEKQPAADEERPKHEAIVEETVKERTTILNEFLSLMQNQIKKHTRLSNMLLQQLEIKAKVEAIGTLRTERTSETRRVKRALDEAHAEFEEAKKDSTAKLKLLKEKIQEVDDTTNTEFRELEREDAQKDESEQWTTESVEILLDTERAKLDLNHATDSGVIKVYEDREKRIQSLKDNAESKERKCQKLVEKIEKTRNLWYPALTDLVTAIGEKFSAAFDRIGRAGEIRISESEDYDKWAIEIYVKFRDEEPLTLLTGTRQSGGERSLTTIMYLMSLTEYARAPFSLVDEINQGMDQEYERSVHNQLVNVTCKADSGQYFLITPKLLPGLKYHKAMKILCVNNGEWLPESRGLGNLGKMIDDVKNKRTKPSAC